MDFNRKKDPMDIFNGTSAAMGSSPFPMPASYTKKPTSVNPTPSPIPRAAANTQVRQPNGVRFNNNANIRQGNGVRLADVGAPAPITKIDALTSPNKFGQALTKAADTAYDTSYNAVVDTVNGVASGARNFYRGTQGLPADDSPVFSRRNTNPVPATATPNVAGGRIINRPGATNFQQSGNLGGVESGSVAASVDANGNPVYDNSSIAKLDARNGNSNVVAGDQPFTRASLNQPAAFDGRDLARGVVTDQRGVARDVRNDASSFQNPMSNDAETLRRIEIAGGSYKGSPSTRRAVMEALGGQLTAGNRASSAYQDGANDAFTRGQAGDIQAGLNQQQTKGQAIVQDLQQAGNDRLERIKNENQGSLATGADGNAYFVRGTQANEVTGPDGKPFKGQRESLTQKDVLSSLADQLKSYDDLNDPDGTQRQATRAQMNQLIGGGKQAPAAPEVGTEQSGYRFKGGDPSDKANWEKIK